MFPVFICGRKTLCESANNPRTAKMYFIFDTNFFTFLKILIIIIALKNAYLNIRFVIKINRYND